MARIPTPEEIKNLQASTIKAEQAKIRSHLRLGKEFILDSVGYSSGVLPEKVWDNLPGKKLDDPEAIE